jgi:hypothetical protein
MQVQGGGSHPELRLSAWAACTAEMAFRDGGVPAVTYARNVPGLSGASPSALASATLIVDGVVRSPAMGDGSCVAVPREFAEPDPAGPGRVDASAKICARHCDGMGARVRALALRIRLSQHSLHCISAALPASPMPPLPLSSSS